MGGLITSVAFGDTHDSVNWTFLARYGSQGWGEKFKISIAGVYFPADHDNSETSALCRSVSKASRKYG
jgi:hypothetical protein